jgi:HAD superfamily hydrolase (TIGR01509 family)
MAKAVIFDFDGVVVNSEPLHYKTFSEILAPLGIKISRSTWYEEFAGTGSRSILKRLFDQFEVEADVEQYVQRRKKLYASHVKTGKLKPNKGLRKFLTRLKTQNIRTAIASGGHNSNIELVLTKLGLIDEFGLIVGSRDVLRSKPDPEVFLLAAKRLKVKPKECIVIEDSIYGSEAACRAGMRLVCFDSPARLTLNNSCIKVINSYSEFPFELLE